MAEKKTEKAAKKAPKATVAAKSVQTQFTSTKELREKTTAELATKLSEVQKDLADARRGLAAGELVNPRVIGAYKKDIARLKTLIVEKARAEHGKEDA